MQNSNDKLRAEIKELQQENKLLKQRLLELGEKLEDKELQRKNLMEKIYKANKDNKEPKPLGKKPGTRGYQRPQPKDSEVTETLEFKPARCPYCKRSDGLNEPQETVIKYQEDIVIVPDKIVKKYVIHKCWCSHCQEYIRSDKAPSPQSINRLGANLTAYILYARYKLRLPFNKIKQSLKDLHNFDISEGEISDQLEQAHQLFGQDYETIKQLVKISDKVYCDETGWRIKGRNFWIWVFVTDKGTRYVIEDTRGKGAAEKALGDKEDRVLITDFYAAYKNLPGTNQYCWVHLLRDSKLTQSVFHNDLQTIYHQLKKELAKDLTKRNYKRLDRLLDDLSKKQYSDKNITRVRQLQDRISKTRAELLTCLKYKDVLPENNPAERALRNNVVMRKIFGGSRSIKSAKVMEVNTSVIDTWLMNEPDKTFMQVVLPKIKQLQGEELGC